MAKKEKEKDKILKAKLQNKPKLYIQKLQLELDKPLYNVLA
jgi:hypothetical protein